MWRVQVGDFNQRAGPFASPLDPSVHGSSASHRFHSKNPFASESQQDTYSTDLFTHRPKLNKAIKNPVDYDGTQSLRDYLKHFERCSVVNGWNQEEAALFLAAGLRGEAQKVLNGMSDSDCRNYAKIVDKLELRFGVEKQRELHQVRLHNRRQLESSCCRYSLSVKFSLSGLISGHSRKIYRPPLYWCTQWSRRHA